MNRHVCAATALLLALHCLAPSDVRAQAVAPAGRSVETAWQAERAFHLNSVMERARATMGNGMLTEWERDAMYRVVVRLLVS